MFNHRKFFCLKHILDTQFLLQKQENLQHAVNPKFAFRRQNFGSFACSPILRFFFLVSFAFFCSLTEKQKSVENGKEQTLLSQTVKISKIVFANFEDMALQHRLATKRSIWRSSKRSYVYRKCFKKTLHFPCNGRFVTWVFVRSNLKQIEHLIKILY